MGPVHRTGPILFFAHCLLTDSGFAGFDNEFELFRCKRIFGGIGEALESHDFIR